MVSQRHCATFTLRLMLACHRLWVHGGHWLFAVWSALGCHACSIGVGVCNCMSNWPCHLSSGTYYGGWTCALAASMQVHCPCTKQALLEVVCHICARIAAFLCFELSGHAQLLDCAVVWWTLAWCVHLALRCDDHLQAASVPCQAGVG